MSTYLIFGASRGYGQDIYEELVSKGHTVYSAQRTPPRLLATRPELHGFWHKVNATLPDQVLLTLVQFGRLNITFDGVVFALATKQPINPMQANVYDLQTHFMVNVSSPVTSMLYMANYGILKPNASATFLLDGRAFNPEVHKTEWPYFASKASLAFVARKAAETASIDLRVKFLTLPEYREGLGDQMTQTILSSAEETMYFE